MLFPSVSTISYFKFIYLIIGGSLNPTKIDYFARTENSTTNPLLFLYIEIKYWHEYIIVYFLNNQKLFMSIFNPGRSSKAILLKILYFLVIVLKILLLKILFLFFSYKIWFLEIKSSPIYNVLISQT
jgi:hypothetical protein